MTSDRQRTQELLRRAREGDRDAFALLFEPYRALVMKVAYRLVGEAGCDDVVLETCVKGWQALPRFKGGDALGRWWCRIARNAALDELRRRKRLQIEVSLHEGIEDEEGSERTLMDELPDPRAPSPAELADNRDVGELVDRAMAQLSREHRATLLMREVDGLSYLQVAAATGVSIGTVMSRLFHARRKLRGLLRSYDESLAR